MKMMDADVKFMRAALRKAKKAAALWETPVGAVIVKDGKIIATGYNKREAKKNALLHAEIIAIARACKKLGGWRLCGCTIYVTLEPCAMCGGAIINARIGRVVYGAPDKRFGAMGSICDLSRLPFNHSPEVTAGILAEECASVLKDFFQKLRNESHG